MTEDAERHALATQVRDRRTAAGMTQEALAARAGVTQTQVWKIEAGAVNPTLRTLARIADALGCGVGDLFGCGPRS